MSVMPDKIDFKSKSQQLELVFGVNSYLLPAEFLRVHSPSAEVRGHGSEGGVLPVGKKDVRINGVEPVGLYALKIVFDDGHDSGLYDWNYLKYLGENKDALWQEYLKRLAETGQSRSGLFIQAKQV